MTRLLGAPRRTSDVSYLGSATAAAWHPEMVGAAIGGAVLFVSICLFAYVAVGTLVLGRHSANAPEFRFAATDEKAMPTPAVFDRLGMWAAAAIVLAVVAYAGPIHEQLAQQHFLAPGMRTW